MLVPNSNTVCVKYKRFDAEVSKLNSVALHNHQSLPCIYSYISVSDLIPPIVSSLMSGQQTNDLILTYGFHMLDGSSELFSCGIK